MSAVAVDVTTTEVLAAAGYGRSVTIQNLGPNAIYVDIEVDAAVATGIQIAATSGIITLELDAGLAINGITTSAIQSTPADTRVLAA